MDDQVLLVLQLIAAQGEGDLHILLVVVGPVALPVLLDLQMHRRVFDPVFRDLVVCRALVRDLDGGRIAFDGILLDGVGDLLPVRRLVGEMLDGPFPLVPGSQGKGLAVNGRHRIGHRIGTGLFAGDRGLHSEFNRIAGVVLRLRVLPVLHYVQIGLRETVDDSGGVPGLDVVVSCFPAHFSLLAHIDQFSALVLLLRGDERGHNLCVQFLDIILNGRRELGDGNGLPVFDRDDAVLDGEALIDNGTLSVFADGVVLGGIRIFRIGCIVERKRHSGAFRSIPHTHLIGEFLVLVLGALFLRQVLQPLDLLFQVQALGDQKVEADGAVGIAAAALQIEEVHRVLGHVLRAECLSAASKELSKGLCCGDRGPIVVVFFHSRCQMLKIDRTFDGLMDTAHIQHQHPVHEDPDVIVAGELKGHRQIRLRVFAAGGVVELSVQAGTELVVVMVLGWAFLFPICIVVIREWEEADLFLALNAVCRRIFFICVAVEQNLVVVLAHTGVVPFTVVIVVAVVILSEEALQALSVPALIGGDATLSACAEQIAQAAVVLCVVGLPVSTVQHRIARIVQLLLDDPGVGHFIVFLDV